MCRDCLLELSLWDNLSRLRRHCVSAEFKKTMRNYRCVFTDWLAGLFPAVWGQTCHPFLKEYQYQPYPAESVPSQCLTRYEGCCREEKQSSASRNTDRSYSVIQTTWNHSRGTLFHVRSSYEEGNTDVELIRHRFALNQTKLANVVAMVWSVDEVGVVQLACLHQHVKHLQMKTRFKTNTVQFI